MSAPDEIEPMPAKAELEAIVARIAKQERLSVQIAPVPECPACGEPPAAGEMWCPACLRTQTAERVASLDARIPRRYRAAALDRPEHAPIRAWADEVSAGSDGSLVLAGPVRSGKTWAMFAAARRLVAEGWRGQTEWIYAPQLLHDLGPGSALEREERRGLLARLETADLLLLDDLGAHFENRWAEEKILLVIDARWREMRPCVVTTNLPPGEIAGSVGDRVADRLARMGRAVVLRAQR